jgi:outer membrane receptor protein involved in Fe transport
MVNVTRTTADPLALPQQIEVIGAGQISRATSDDVADLLKKHAAVDVIQYPGLLSGVGIRGFRPQFSGINTRTLILVDGRPAGTSNLSLLDLNAVERVEVLKGPASALYGSNAMGGVVNLVTRRSTGPVHGSATAGYGSFSTYEARGSAGGSIGEAADFDLSVAARGRNGDYRAGDGELLRGLVGRSEVIKTFANDSSARVQDPAGGSRSFSEYGTLSGSARAGFSFAPRWRVDARAEGMRAEGVQNPGDLTASYDSRSLKDIGRQSASLAVNGTPGAHELLLRLYAAGEDADYYNAPEAIAGNAPYVQFRSPARWLGMQLQDEIAFGAHRLVAGLDWAGARSESERFTEPGAAGAPYAPNSAIDSRALFAEGYFQLPDERFVATLGARLDDIGFEVAETSLFGDAFSEGNSERYTVFHPNAGLQFTAPGGLRVHGTAGKAFVAPDAFHVAGYSQQRAGAGAVAITRGNPELAPESSFTWDAGAGWNQPRRGVNADATFFATRVINRITSERTTPDAPIFTDAGDTVRSVTRYFNADEARIRGVEARASIDAGVMLERGFSLLLHANGTRLLRAEEISGGSESRIRNVADLTLNFGADYDNLGRFRAGILGRYVGARTDTDFSDFSNVADVLYPPFMTLDANAEIRVAPGYRISLGITNLTDENFYEVRGYPLPGRALLLRLTAFWGG